MTTVLGILGGIGSGKSTISRVLSQMGALVLDADRMAHEVIERPEIVERIAREFGRDVVGPDGRILRPALAARVFGPGGEPLLPRLNAIVHPEVGRRLESAIADARRENTPVVVLDVPLLLESSLDRLCDRLLFVKASDADRRARCAARGWDASEFDRRESRQRPLHEKEAAADIVVTNDGDLARLESAAAEVFRTLTSTFGGKDG